jgi:hypothetical protein
VLSLSAHDSTRAQVQNGGPRSRCGDSRLVERRRERIRARATLGTDVDAARITLVPIGRSARCSKAAPCFVGIIGDNTAVPVYTLALMADAVAPAFRATAPAAAGPHLCGRRSLVPRGGTPSRRRLRERRRELLPKVARGSTAWRFRCRMFVVSYHTSFASRVDSRSLTCFRRTERGCGWIPLHRSCTSYIQVAFVCSLELRCRRLFR